MVAFVITKCILCKTQIEHHVQTQIHHFSSPSSTPKVGSVLVCVSMKNRLWWLYPLTAVSLICDCNMFLRPHSVRLYQYCISCATVVCVRSRYAVLINNLCYCFSRKCLLHQPESLLPSLAVLKPLFISPVLAPFYTCKLTAER